MFGLFKISEKDKLNKQYARVMNEAYKYSRYNRRLSDKKYAEADLILKKLESLGVNK